MGERFWALFCDAVYGIWLGLWAGVGIGFAISLLRIVLG